MQSFIIELFDTFQSLTPWVQVVALLVPPGFVVVVLALFLSHRRSLRALSAGSAPAPWSGRLPSPADAKQARRLERAMRELADGDRLFVRRDFDGELILERFPSMDRLPLHDEPGAPAFHAPSSPVSASASLSDPGATEEASADGRPFPANDRS